MHPCWRSLRVAHTELYHANRIFLRNCRATAFLTRCRAASTFSIPRRTSSVGIQAEPTTERVDENLNTRLRTEGQSTAVANDVARQTKSSATSEATVSPRLARKLRRKQQGKYRPLAKAAEENFRQIEVEDIESLLSRLDQLGGPKEWKENPILANERRADRSGAEPTPDQSQRSQSKKQVSKTPVPDGIAKGPITSATTTKRERWQVQKEALEHKFGDSGWKPRKRLSPDTLEGIRALYDSDRTTYTTETLAEHFKVSKEAVRRILKSKWRPNDEEAEDRRARWEKRGIKKWQEMAEHGAKPPSKWRSQGVKSHNEQRGNVRRHRTAVPLSWAEVVGRATVD